jgi:hypothetical protein
MEFIPARLFTEGYKISAVISAGQIMRESRSIMQRLMNVSDQMKKPRQTPKRSRRALTIMVVVAVAITVI